MREAFAFRVSPEATSDENIIKTADAHLDIGKGVVDFGWVLGRNEARTHRPRRYEFLLADSPQRDAERSWSQL